MSSSNPPVREMDVWTVAWVDVAFLRVVCPLPRVSDKRTNPSLAVAAKRLGAYSSECDWETGLDFNCFGRDLSVLNQSGQLDQWVCELVIGKQSSGKSTALNRAQNDYSTPFATDSPLIGDLCRWTLMYDRMGILLSRSV